MNDIEAAKILISCLDLTSLGDKDTDVKIEELCRKAVTPYGKVAAVCVYPKFIPLVKRLLGGSEIKTATVVNFPKGTGSIETVQTEIQNALKLGADEIDAVFPYRRFLDGDEEYCRRYLAAVREACGKKHTLKIILETGEIIKAAKIARAAELCLEAEVDFIKTSTGKSKISATPEAANIILETIHAAHKNTGFKASGGIRTLEEAKKYLVLANAVIGPKATTPKRLRIGASSLLDDLLNVIARGY